MAKKILAVFVAVLSCFMLSVGAFAATGEAQPETFTDAAFTDWEQAGDSAKSLAEAYINYLKDTVTGELTYKTYTDIPLAWFKFAVDGALALSPVDDIYYTLRSDGLYKKDVYSGTDWSQITNIGEGGAVPAPASAGLSGIISTLTAGVGGVFKIAGSGFTFITGNALTMFMVSISFAGIAVAFVGRAFKTARK